MKHVLLTTIAAVLLVGCGESQPPEPPTVKAPDISIHFAAAEGNIEAVIQHLANGVDVNVKNDFGFAGTKGIADFQQLRVYLSNPHGCIYQNGKNNPQSNIENLASDINAEPNDYQWHQCNKGSSIQC